MAGQETVRPVNFSGSLSQFKNVTTNGFGPQHYVGPVTPGGTKMPTPNRGPDTGMFAGSGTPLNSSIGMQDTSRKHVTNVIKNLAIQEVGGAAIGKAVGWGIAAARPMYYGLHGTGEAGLTNLVPKMGQNVESFLQNMTNIGKTSVTSPKVFSYKPEVGNILPVTDYAQMAGGQGTGSAYLARTPARNIASNIVDTSKAISGADAFAARGLVNEQMSNKAMKVVQEFPMRDYTKRTYDSMEAAWETSQSFKELPAQVNAAIATDKAARAARAVAAAKAATTARTIKKK